jgi:hypothetical protein
MSIWKPLQNQPNFNADTMLLLTDGTVMCHETYGLNAAATGVPSSQNACLHPTLSSELRVDVDLRTVITLFPDDVQFPAAGPTERPAESRGGRGQLV